jgi:hypothetical protein
MLQSLNPSVLEIKWNIIKIKLLVVQANLDMENLIFGQKLLYLLIQVADLYKQGSVIIPVIFPDIIHRLI